MALAQSVTINGFNARTKFGLEITSIDTRGLGPVRRSTTVGGEMVGRVGQTVFHDEHLIRLSGQISGSGGNPHDNLMNLIKALAQTLGVGQDGKRTFTLKFEDSSSLWICQYAGEFQVRDISPSWFKNSLAEISFLLVVQDGSALDVNNTHTFTSIGDKHCKLVQPIGSDYPVRPKMVLKNTNASAITACTLLNFAKRRVVRKLTGTLGGTASFTPTTGAFGRGFNVTTGSDTYSFATSKLYPHAAFWTIAFRFKRVFTTSSRTFWETTNGNNRLRYNSTSGNLELVLNNVVSATFASPLTALSTSAFAWVVCRNKTVAVTFTSQQDIFIDGVVGTSANDTPPSTDPGANIYFGTNAAAGERAEGIFDEIVIWNRALDDSEIAALNALNRPLLSLEDVCLYVDFENDVNGVGYSNIETSFTSISLAQNDSLVLDCQNQTAKKITNLWVTSDQLSAFSGEFQVYEPMDNALQLLQTGGGATGTDLTIFYPHRRAA